MGRRLLGFSRRKWLNSYPPAVRHHFGGRALLHRRHANRLEMRDDGFPVYVADETANLQLVKRHGQELLRRDIGGYVQPLGLPSILPNMSIFSGRPAVFNTDVTLLYSNSLVVAYPVSSSRISLISREFIPDNIFGRDSRRV